MLKNYFKIAWRNLKANKFYSFINISGLAIGLATGIILLLWVQNELSYDKFNRDYENIYRLSAHFKANGKGVTWEGVPGPLAIFAKNIPQVKSIVRITGGGNLTFASGNQKNIMSDNKTVFADSNFLSMFDFKLLEGDKKDLFPNINSVIVTQSTAKKFFGKSDPIGKILTLISNKNIGFTVTGVLQDFPHNSSLRYDVIIPMGYYAQEFTARGGNGNWKTIDADLGDYAFSTFVKLLPGSSPVKVGNDFSSLYKDARNGSSTTLFKLENLGDIHLISADSNVSDLRTVQIFMLVAILLLLIAGINYVNMSTARSLIRVKEVSIRKIVGADKRQLFFQFFAETFLLFCFAIVLAFVLIELLMPMYNYITGEVLYYSLSNFAVWQITGYAVVGTLLAASIYPAVFLSSFKPIQSLKGKTGSGKGTALFRKMLVVFQFAVSVILIVSTFVIGSQLNYVRNKNLGYDKSYVFTVSLSENAIKHMTVIKNELKNQPGIVNVAQSSIYDMAELGDATGDLDWPGKSPNNNIIITQAAIGKDFIPTMKIHFLEGGNFAGNAADSSHYIVNETAVKAMGLKPPYVGQQISFHLRKGTIIGVVKDFNFESLKVKISPLLFYSWKWKGNFLFVRTTAKDAQHAIAAVKEQYDKYAGSTPFSYNFLDAQFAKLYESDQQTGTLFNMFASIAICISCLGLMGLTTFMAQRRTKEIGVRKVLGAGVPGIITLISMDYLKLVVIAIVIAIPFAWWSMNEWLQNFAYRIKMGMDIFLLAATLTMAIAIATISWQSVKAAFANPVKSLRYE